MKLSVITKIFINNITFLTKMLNEQTIITIIEDWRKKTKEQLLYRFELENLIKGISKKEIIDILGVRRCGKSSIIFLLIQKLKLEDSDYIYINFEDPMFINYYSIDLLEQIWNTYITNYSPKKKPFVFFDEIQYIKGWEQWVRKYNELNKANIIVTGSSSELLGKELGTKLTGRHKSYIINPLSFEEFIIFNNQKLPNNNIDALKNKTIFQKLLKNYINMGGFPQIVLTKDMDLLKNYFEDMIYKDIVVRHSIRDVNKLRMLAKYCFTNISSKFSNNSLKKTLGMSIDSIQSYISYLKESFLIYDVPLFSYSLKKQEYNPKKIYSIDTGLRNSVCFMNSKDIGKLTENIVFLQLKKYFNDIFYFQGKNEVDFICKTNKLFAINVTFTDNISDREIKGLVEFKENYKSKIKKLIIITKDFEDEKDGINYIPLWKFLLFTKNYIKL
jgi:uncharacterized protein